MDKEFLRQSTCNQCIHGTAKGINYKKSHCEITKREGNAERACYCAKFVSRLDGSSSLVSPQGFPYRSRQIEDYRTRRQWEEAGYKVKIGEEGHKMHSSMNSSKTFVYYLPEEVESITVDPLPAEKSCATCSLRNARYCEIAGSYVNLSHKCSEWNGGKMKWLTKE